MKKNVVRRKRNGNGSRQTFAQWIETHSEADCLKIPLAAMRECGEASQTLGAFMKLEEAGCGFTVEQLANLAGLSISTVIEHLEILGEKGWIEDVEPSMAHNCLELKTT